MILGLQSTASMPTGVATTTTNPDLIVPSISIDGLAKGMQNISMDREVSEGKTSKTTDPKSNER